jgi:ribonuclease HII
MPRLPMKSDIHPSNDPSAILDLDAWGRSGGHRLIAGVDEVGRGPLAGPVVAAAVILPEEHGIEGIADSKELTPSKREKLSQAIQQKALSFGLGVVGPERIDEINILRASLEAMSIAMRQLIEKGTRPDLVLVDGTFCFPWPESGAPLLQKPFVRADARSQVVGAASILAKVHRDAMMVQYHARWPHYGFDRHKGYPTADHRRALREHGLCEIHRKTFAGVET